MEWYPLVFKPVYRDYLWGGNRIITAFDRDEPDGVYAESWEVSTRPEGMSVAAHGPWKGQTLAEITARDPAGLLGSCVKGTEFPLLIKLIDSRERLSVQVHPDDESAAAYGGEAKTEMWYILDGDPDASVFAGLRPAVTRKQFKAAIEACDLEDLLITLPVKKGDAVYMPGGTVHAIDAGCLILEVQQNSNTTYRIYDWGRVGPDGKPRELHIDQAMEVITWDNPLDARVQQRRLGFFASNELWEVLTCDYFRMERLVLNEEWNTALDGKTFHVLFCTSGSVTLASGNTIQPLCPGTSCLLPAALPEYRLLPEGNAEVIRITAR